MFKMRYVLLIVLLLSLVFIFSACGRKGELSINELPVVEITSYEGDTTSVDLSVISFQQKIYWSGYDPDGVVEGYAFRIIGENENPITTPWHDVIVEDAENPDENGWIYHYLPGADESTPLAETEARSIWTDQVYAVINFPANLDGDSLTTTSIFEIKCVDSDGDESAVVRKYYQAISNKPTCNGNSSQGTINGKNIGTGIVFNFKIGDNDQFIEGDKAAYFDFKLEKIDQNGEVIPVEEGGYPDNPSAPDGGWWTTNGQNNIHDYFVCLDDENGTRPALLLNSVTAHDSTRLISKAIDLAGIESDESITTFFVKEGFYPGTLIYSGLYQPGHSQSNDILALGRNHFTVYNTMNQVIPSVYTSEGERFSTHMWVDKNGELTCLYSVDLKIYMHWGYYGEYEQSNPNLVKKSFIFDEETGTNYFTEIKYFDVRLDGEAFYYAPLPSEENNFVDPDGTEWLRIPANHDIAQNVIVTGLEPGTHRFEVRAVDLQNVADETPSNLIFKVILPIIAEEKEGILVLDDTRSHNMYSPEAYVDSLYSTDYYFQNYDGTVDVFDRLELNASAWNGISVPNREHVFSPTDLQNYKTVIYFSDRPTDASNFEKEYNPLYLYLRGGGNLILSGGANLNGVTSDLARIPILDTYFGIQTDEEDAIVAHNNVWVTGANGKRYFVNAVNNGSGENISILEPHFNDYVTDNPNPLIDDTTLAIAPVSYFNKDLLRDGVEAIYTFGCKAYGDGNIAPTEAGYNFLIEQPVAIKKQTNESKCYLFGFPLSYMNPADVETMLMQIIDEIEK